MLLEQKQCILGVCYYGTPLVHCMLEVVASQRGSVATGTG